MFIYGIEVFTKFLGYFGEIVECPHCHRKYKKAMIQLKKWNHLNYIPLIPAGTTFWYACPICNAGKEIKKKEAVAIMQGESDPHQQNIQVYGKRVREKIPTKKLATDKSYELWTRDLITGEDLCIKTDLTRQMLKKEQKDRGLKEMTISDN